MTIGNPAFCLALYLTGVHFGGEKKLKCQPIKTREIAVSDCKRNYVIDIVEIKFLSSLSQ